MKIDDLERLYAKARANPKRAALYMLASAVISITGIWIFAYTNQKAIDRASQPRNVSTEFKILINGHLVLMQGNGETFSSAVRVEGADTGMELGKAIREWLAKNHPGFTYEYSSIPVTEDGRTYLSLKIHVNDRTNASRNLHFDISELLDHSASQEQDDYHAEMCSVFDGVSLAIKGHLGRIGLVTDYGTEIREPAYVEQSTGMDSDPDYQSAQEQLLQTALERSSKRRSFRDPLTGVLLRKKLGVLERILIDEADGGLGSSCGFSSTNALSLTVYFYDNNLRGIPDSCEGKIVEEEFRNAKEAALFIYSNRSKYSHAGSTDCGNTSIGKENHSLELLSCFYRIEFAPQTNASNNTIEQLTPGNSVLMIRGIGDAFLKIRASFPEQNANICETELVTALDELAVAVSKRARH